MWYARRLAQKWRASRAWRIWERLAVSAVLATVAAAHAQQPQEPVDISPLNGETYYIVNQQTGLQADLNNGSVVPGSTILQQTRSFTSLTQRWALTLSSTNVWKISNIFSGLCLDSSTAAGATFAVQNTCVASATQQWALSSTSNGYYTLSNQGSGLLLDLSASATGSALVETALSSSATQSQQWLLRPVFFRGIDNALLEKQEANKVTNTVPWWNDAEQRNDVLAILKAHGVNMVRIRPTTVPPYNTYTPTTCSGNGCYAETDAQDIDLAKRAKNLGMSVELTFLYDGGSSASIPGNWSSYTLSQAEAAVYSYVKAEVEAYRQAGAMPDMVTIGNEVDTGLIGSLASPRTSFSSFAAIEQQGMQAVADASSDASIGAALPMPIRCIHITPAYNLSSFFSSANSYSIPYDAMCQSYYPIYHGPLTAAQAAASNPNSKPVEQSVLSAAVTAIGKPIFLIEVGEHYENGFDANDPWYAATVTGQRQFLVDVNGVLKGLPNNLGMGMEYWDATGVNVYVSGGGYSNGDGKIDALYTWNGLTIFDNADTQGYSNASLGNYSATLPGLDALGGRLDPALSYKLVNKATGQILETTLASTASAAPLDTTTDTGVISQHQQWIVSSNNDGYFQVANGNNGSGTNVLDSSGSLAAGSTVVQNPATSASSQEWNVVTAGGGYFALVNRASGLVLAANSVTSIEQTSPGSVVTDWVIAANANQLWQIVPVHITASSTPSQLQFASAIPASITTGGNLGSVTVNVTNMAAAVIGTPDETITLTLSGPQSSSQTIASSGGTATFNLSTVTLSQTGSYTLTASAPGLNTAAVTVVVSLPVLTVTATSPQRSYGAANPTLSYAITGYVNGDNSSVVSGTPSLSTPAAASSPSGNYPITVGLGTLQSSNYTFSFVNGTLTVTLAGTTTILASSAPRSTFGSSVTLTAAVMSTTTGTPTGNVAIFSGSSQIGTATLVSGMATYTTASLASGTNSLSAQYAGDTNFSASISNSVSVIVSPQNIWVINSGGTISELTNSGSPISANGYTGGGLGIAIDHAGDVSSATAADTLTEVSNTGSAVGTFSGGGVDMATSLAVDGSGNLWVANANNTLSLFNNTGTALTPAAGYSGVNLNAPSSIAIDNSGSVWVANTASSSVTRFLGAAGPVATPLATNVQNGTLGVKP
jgi:arabinogalactan endo-1,4-beta-galactosidase